jgi:hypothetical protein
MPVAISPLAMVSDRPHRPLLDLDVCPLIEGLARAKHAQPLRVPTSSPSSPNHGQMNQIALKAGKSVTP